MAKWLLSFLLIAGTSGSQLKRQRVSLVHPGQAALQEEGAAATGAIGPSGRELGQPDCPFPLLPWTLVFLLCFSFALYVFSTEEQKGGGAGSDLEITTDEELLREILGVLRILQDRLWQMVRERRKHQRLPHCNKAKVC